MHDRGLMEQLLLKYARLRIKNAVDTFMDLGMFSTYLRDKSILSI